MLSSSSRMLGVHARTAVRPRVALLRQQQQQRCYAAKGRRGSSPQQQTPIDDEDDSQEPPTPPAVKLEQTSVSVDYIISEVDKKVLDLHPEYQRGLVWTRRMASHLVMTVLENRVVPPVFVENTGRTKSIMDGKQRLCSIIAFVTGRSPVAGWHGAPVQLDIDTEHYHPWYQGKTFADLSEERQWDLNNYKLSMYEVPRGTPRDEVFKIYRDINSGGMAHSDQQLRKSTYHGTYVKLLDELVKDKAFLRLQGRDKPDDDKEEDRELLLRLFSWLDGDYVRYRGPLFRWLNTELEDNRNAPQDWLDQRRASLKTLLDVADQVWGLERAFRSSSGDKKLKWDPYLWDTLGPGLITHLEAKHSSKQQLVRAGPQLRSGLEALLGSPEWQRALTRKAVTKRMELVQQLLSQVTSR